MSFASFLNDPLSLSSWPGGSDIRIIRGDLIHPIVSGNKLYKLQPFLDVLNRSTSDGLISVGGRYSNHLHALAFACYSLGKASVGLVRGYPEQPMTSTLLDCERWGMTFHFLSKADYEKRYRADFWQTWTARYPQFIAVNEGGWSEAGVEGSALWWRSIPEDTKSVICAVGSGATLAGLVKAAPSNVQVVGVPAFKDPSNYGDLRHKLASMGIRDDRYQLWVDHDNRGFGKLTPEQEDFRKRFLTESGVELDRVYNTKSFFALHRRLQSQSCQLQTPIAVIHSGGLQGNRS